MVKNYIVGAARKITNGWHKETNQDLYQQYLEMYKMRLASFGKFVQEPFEAVLWTEEVADNEAYTKANWQATWDLWHSEPCNIFWAGCDTIMVKPTSLFSLGFTEYRLFNWTDPKYHPHFPEYFNDDIMYYPHTMSDRVWEYGQRLWQFCDSDPERNWGFDQRRHNSMFWSQNIPAQQTRHPALAFQAQHLRNLNDMRMVGFHEGWNQLAIEQAHIIHFHGSRGSQQVIAVMRELCRRLDITV
jgi:hypothetical protein